MRNYDYDVKVTIAGEGEDEPGKFTKKGSLNVVIDVLDWKDGKGTDIEI